MVRHVICSRSDIFKGRWRATSDLKAPTYKDLQPSLREASFRHEEANEHDSTQSVW